MMVTRGADPKNTAEALEHLRGKGVPDEILAKFAVTFYDFQITTGNTQEELDGLRALVPEAARFELASWTVIHGKTEP